MAIRTTYDTYVRSAAGADVDAQPFGLGVNMRFTLLYLENGKVGLRTQSNNYITAIPGNPGRVGDISVLKPWETFELIKNTDGTFSFKSFHDTYLTATPAAEGGRLQAKSPFGDSAKFTLVELQGPFTITKEEKVAIRSFYGTYVRSLYDSPVDVHTSITDQAKFSLLHLSDGRVGLRNSNGFFVSTTQESPGRVVEMVWLKSWETYELIQNSDGNVNFKSSHSTYLIADPAGDGAHLRARNTLGDDAKFTLVYLDNDQFQVVREEKVAIQTVFGTYVRSLPNSNIDVQSSVNDQAKFSLLYLKNGNVGLRTANNTFVSILPGNAGKVSVNDSLQKWESFRLIQNWDGSVSLKTANGEFLRANFGGEGSSIEAQLNGNLGPSTRFNLVQLESA